MPIAHLANGIAKRNAFTPFYRFEAVSDGLQRLCLFTQQVDGVIQGLAPVMESTCGNELLNDCIPIRR